MVLRTWGRTLYWLLKSSVAAIFLRLCEKRSFINISFHSTLSSQAWSRDILGHMPAGIVDGMSSYSKMLVLLWRITTIQIANSWPVKSGMIFSLLFSWTYIWQNAALTRQLTRTFKRAGIDHGDTRPANVLRKPDGSLRLIDFECSLIITPKPTPPFVS